MSWVKKFRKFLAKAAPIITVVVAVVAPHFAAAIGNSMGFTGTAANAVGSAVISGSTTAVAGGDVGDIIKSAVIGGASAGIGDVAGGAAAGAAKGAGYSDEVASILGATAGGGAGSATQAALQGEKLKDVLKQGAIGAIAAGGTQGTIEAFGRETPQTGVTIPRSGSAADVPEIGLRTGTPGAAPDMGGGTGIIPPSDAFLPVSTRRDIAAGRAMISPEGDVVPTMRTSDGRIVRATTTDSGDLIPYSSTQTTSYDLGGQLPRYGERTDASISRPYQDYAIGQFGEQVLREFIYPELANITAGLLYKDTGTPAATTQTLGGAETTGTPSSAALAQALRVGDAGEPVFGSEAKGKQKRVWNVSSLKLKDEVGG